MSPLRILLFIALLLLLGLAPVIGGETRGGGDGGIIILPSAVAMNSLGSSTSPRQISEIADTRKDMILQLPGNMGDSIAIISLPEDSSSTLFILREGQLYLSGDHLEGMRDAGIECFVITIVSYDGMALRMDYNFEPEFKAKLFVF
ncbi:MAG: hypothetical protein ACYTG5_12065 [Planctomycetota bacterium]|jgi:hypothetical protein